MPRVIAIIPARRASSRFPDKLLAADTGRPLIAHTVEAASRAIRCDHVAVAADDAAFREALGAAAPGDIEVILTDPAHPNGTSRLAEAASLMGLDDDDIVVNVQGDEPEIDPASIDAAVEQLVASGAAVATIAAPITSDADLANPNIVKVVRAASGDALYFSRAPIPHQREAVERAPETPLRHVGLYVYRVSALKAYVALPETPLERTERLEQLRLLEHGVRISVAVVGDVHPGIDTPEQYRAFVQRWRVANPE